MPGADDLPNLVRERLFALAPEANHVGVAVSGGGDSVALACLLADAGVPVTLLHVDHGLRASSPVDAASVRALGAGLGVPVGETVLDVRSVAALRGWNLADAARRLRLAALHRLGRDVGADVLAVGHTCDDQAETVVLQLLRGTAFARGMAPRRGRIIRPLLGVRRAALRVYLRARGTPWREDPSNHDPASRRARVRHEVLPALEAIAPGVTERLARLAEVQRDVETFLRQEVHRRVRGLQTSREGGRDTGAPLPAEGLDARTLGRLPAALQREALATLARAAGVSIDLAHLDAVRRRLPDVTPWRLSLAGGWSVRGAYGRVALHPPTTTAHREPAREVGRPEGLPPGVDPAVLAAGPLALRPRRPGDVIRLPGGRRSVADLLVDRKVPRHRRDALRVLARGSDVLWIEGVALAVGAGASPGVTRSREEAWMARALELARAADVAGEAPVGAVVVVGERVVGEGENRTERDRDPSAHAEVLALRAAATEVGDWRLTHATLVVTLEPCAMCFGAVLQAHVGRVVYGARNEREGALGGVADLSTEGWKRRVEVQGGVLARECADVLSGAFARRRRSRATDAEG